MTARWISEALDAAIVGGLVHPDKLAHELIERLPIEEMAAAGCETIITANAQNPMGVALALVSSVIMVLVDGAPEVRELTELYQGACRMLDAAGVPYEVGLTDDGDPQIVRLNLAGRIQWLAQQRPTRLELQRVEDERDEAKRHRDKAQVERGAAIDLAADRSDELARSRLEFDVERDRLATDRDYWKALAEARAAAVMPVAGART